MREQFPSLFEPSGTSWSFLSRTKVLFSSGYCNDPHGHFCVLPSVCRLERSYSDPKSFMTCWDWQFGHLVVRLVLVRVFVFWSLWTLNDHFRSKVQGDDIGIQFWRFHQLRKGHFRLVAWSTWLPRFSVWVGAIRRFNFKFKPKFDFGQHSE